MAEKDGELGPDVSRRTGTKEMSSNVRLDEMNLLVAVRSPGLAGASPASSTYGEEWRSTPGKRRRRGGRPRSSLRDAPAHRERVDAVGKVGGRTERPEYSPERGGRRRESATLALILGILGRFLVTRGRGGRRGVEDAVGRVRGWPERRHPGEVVAVVVKLVCLSLNFD
jgi:hypothetical protein